MDIRLNYSNEYLKPYILYLDLHSVYTSRQTDKESI